MVAVLDTGIDTGHPDLRDGIADQHVSARAAAPTAPPARRGPGSAYEDDNGHGTNVSGIITGPGRVAPVGVAPGVHRGHPGPRPGGGRRPAHRLRPGPSSAAPIKVVNMSLGRGAVHHRVRHRRRRHHGSSAARIAAPPLPGNGDFVASGNNAFTDAVTRPACLNAAVAVGAVDDGNLDGGMAGGSGPDATTTADQVTCFSNSSPLVELLAPGALITSAGIGGGTLTEGGTSQASPHAAGAAAVLLEADPGLSPSEIVSVLSQTGTLVKDSKTASPCPASTSKRRSTGCDSGAPPGRHPMGIPKAATSLLGIQPGEGRSASLMLAHAFAMGVGTVFFETAASALFLAHFGAPLLPYVYIAAAVLNTLTGLVYPRVQERVPFARLMARRSPCSWPPSCAFRAGLLVTGAGALVFLPSSCTASSPRSPTSSTGRWRPACTTCVRPSGCSG